MLSQIFRRSTIFEKQKLGRHLHTHVLQREYVLFLLWITFYIVFASMRVKPISFSYFFVLIRLRNARKKNETNSQVNDIDMYNSPNAKPGKNNFKWLVIQSLP